MYRIAQPTSSWFLARTETFSVRHAADAVGL